jgi:hypothetical protein
MALSNLFSAASGSSGDKVRAAICGLCRRRRLFSVFSCIFVS